MPSASGSAVVPAEARVFGHTPVEVELTLVPRSTGWRAGRAVGFLAAGAVLAPVLAVVPPHAPWAVAAGAGGLVLSLRKWGERFTLRGVQGRCPRCDAALGFDGSTPLRIPHSMSCDACGNAVALHVDKGGLPAA